MAYNKHYWQDGELITSDNLNHIEEGISNIPNNNNDLDITVDFMYDNTSSTVYWVSKIPKTDTLGNMVKISHGFGNDSHSAPTQTASEFNTLHKKALLVMNAAPIPDGNVIQDGNIISSGTVAGKETLGIKSDGSLTSYPNGTNIQDMLADGTVNSVAGFFTLIKNGSRYNFEDVAKQDTSSASGYDYLNQTHPRQLIGSDENYYYIITTDGRKQRSIGFTLEDCVRIGLSMNLDFLFNLDGGGSASTIVKGSRVNTILDNGGTSERKNTDFLYIEIPEYSGVFNRNKYNQSAQTVTNYVNTFYNIYNYKQPFLGTKITQSYITLSSEFVNSTYEELQYRSVNGQVSIFGRISINPTVTDTSVIFGENHPIAENIDLGITYSAPVVFNAIVVGGAGSGGSIKIAFDSKTKKMYIYEPSDKLKNLVLQFYTTIPTFN